MLVLEEVRRIKLVVVVRILVVIGMLVVIALSVLKVLRIIVVIKKFYSSLFVFYIYIDTLVLLY